MNTINIIIRHRYLKTLLASWFLLVLTTGLKAQQDPMYTHYLFNTMSINPAYAGSRGVLNVSALSRMQWVGIDGAPLTQTLLAHSPFINYNMGLGITFVNDKIGPVNENLFYVDYSYTINVTENTRLSFGLKAGIDLYSVKLSRIEVEDPADEAFLTDIKGKVLPNFGFGLFYRGDRWYAGFSTPKLLENRVEGNSQYNQISQSRHYFLIGGYTFDINQNLKIKPAALVKMTSGAPLSFDLTADFIIRDRISLGAAFRRGDSFGALMEFKITDQLRAGYAYDFMISELRKASGGSHEIMISYDFKYKLDDFFKARSVK